MKKWKFYPMTMHIHCGHEPKASMESHIYNAAALGMEYIRFTPHDTRTGPAKFAVRDFDFSRGEAVYENESGKARGWQCEGDADVSFNDGHMKVEIQAPKTDALSEGSTKFYSDGKRHTVSLLAGVNMTLGLSAECIGDAWVILDVELSQRPPDHKPAHIFYCLGSEAYEGKTEDRQIPQEAIPPHTALIPLTPDEDGLYRLQISEDAERFKEIVGGLDNAFLFLYVRVAAKNGGRACCRMDKMEINVQKGFEEVVARQRKLGNEIGARYGVKPFLTAEISGAGYHKNYYSEDVPVINYAARGYDVTEAEAIAHVRRYGGIYSFNHPFNNGKYRYMVYSGEALWRVVEREAAALTASRVYGAALLEVGFPEGRGKSFSLKEYLRLWDILSLNGVFVTGCGDSDSHDSSMGWFEGNNFATWIAADSVLQFPVSDKEFIESMKAGRAYMGDPVWLKGDVEFTSEVPMGGIIPVADREKIPCTMTFQAKEVKKGWQVHVVVDGETAAEYTAAENGEFHCSFPVTPFRTVTFARVEMYNADGRCIMLTNPIYLVNVDEYAGEIPKCRLYEN